VEFEHLKVHKCGNKVEKTTRTLQWGALKIEENFYLRQRIVPYTQDSTLKMRNLTRGLLSSQAKSQLRSLQANYSGSLCLVRTLNRTVVGIHLTCLALTSTEDGTFIKMRNLTHKVPRFLSKKITSFQNCPVHKQILMVLYGR
jgi:hypothetical protein